MNLAPLTGTAAETIIEIATTNFNYDFVLTFMSAEREKVDSPDRD